MKYVTLADHAMREYAPDKIFAASQKAKAAIAELGGDAVINSTLGEIPVAFFLPVCKLFCGYDQI